MDLDKFVNRVLNKEKEAAIKLCKESKLIPRIMREDKTTFFGTQELNFERVNLEIDNGIVTNAYLG